MSIGGDVRRGPLTPTEWAALVAGAAVFGYVGWDGALWDARFQLVLHLLAVGAIAGVAVRGLRGGLVPITRIDAPLLALLGAFALATVSALNLGMSLRGMASITATAAMLPVALVAIRHRPTLVGIVTSVPVIALSLPALAVLVNRRIEWILAGAPGLPPIRLAGEGTPFGSVAVPPFVIWPAFALTGLIEPRGLRRTLQAGLLLVGIPLTILSGSRSAWLAIGVAVVAAAVPWAWRRRDYLRRARPDARSIVIGLVALAGLAAVAVFMAPRVTAVTSLIYRVSLWRDTLNAWASDPLLGIGPGFMPFARQAAAPDFTFPVSQPHSHNLPLGVLGDSGVVGLAAAAVLVVSIGWFAGPWRARTPTGRLAGFVLIGLAVGGLFEDLTFLPNFNLLAVGVLAVALTDAGAVSWVRIAPGARRTALVAGGTAISAVLLWAMVVADAGAVAYRAGADASGDADWVTATERFARSAQIDPWQPSGPKALAVTADRAGRPDLARQAAEDAVILNPGDAASWMNLALLCQADGDRDCQARATERVVATARFFRPDLYNAARSYEALGRPDDADDAYRRSLLAQRSTIFATDWPRRVAVGDAELADSFGAQLEFNRLLAWWEMGEPIDPTAIRDPATRALAHAMLGEREASERWLQRAVDANPADIVAWDLVVVLHDHWGQPIEEELRINRVARGRSLPSPDPRPGGGGGDPRTLTYDIGSFRAWPADGFVRAQDGMGYMPPYPWALQQTLP